MTQKYEKPDWFDLKIANLFQFDANLFNRSKFIKKDTNIKTSIFKSNKKPNIIIKNNPSLYAKIYNQLDKLISCYKEKFHKVKNDSQLKTLQTKFTKNLSAINTVTRVKKYIINFNDNQSKTIQLWINECKRIYNICLDKYCKDNTYFNKGYQIIKAKLLNEIYGDSIKPVPYDVITDEIRVFYSNLKSCYTNLKNRNIKHFQMKKKLNLYGNYSLLIPSKSVQQNGIFTTILGRIADFNLGKLPTHDCRLYFNQYQKQYTLMIPTDISCKIIENREPICAIDPGEKKFIQFVGLNSYGYIGKNIRKIILKNRDKIRRYQKILSRSQNKCNYKLRNRKRIITKIKHIYKNSKNVIKELHSQSANYICKNYDKILIPKFDTQKMITHKKQFKDYKKEFINQGTTIKDKKDNAIKFTKRCKLNKNVKYVLQMLSHYQFRQHLLNKTEEYGCEMKVITEEYTSCTCSRCGHMSNNYRYRKKTCENCGLEIDRDLNGAINILIKNINVFKYEAIKPKASYRPIEILV